MEQLLELRRQLISGHMTCHQKDELKLKMVDKINLGTIHKLRLLFKIEKLIELAFMFCYSCYHCFFQNPKLTDTAQYYLLLTHQKWTDFH